MRITIKRCFSVIRGIFLKFRYKISGGKFLQIYPGVHVNCCRKDALFFGEKVVLYHKCGLYLDSPNAKITIGDRTYINQRSEIRCQDSVRIGNECAISWDVTILDSDYHKLISEKESCSAINIGNHVWIGCKSIILKGVTIGDGSVIAAGSLVNRSIPANVLVGGVPAKVLKTNIEWK